MIRVRQATALALTKLRTRKVRLVVTVVISGLLFSILAGASIAARGVFAGIGSFSKEGLGDRYIVQGYPNGTGGYFSNEEVIARAVAIHKDTVEKKKAEAKRLNLDYSSDTEEQPYQEFGGPNGQEQRNLVPTHPAAQQAIREYLEKHPDLSLADFRKEAASYNPKQFYESRALPFDLAGGSIQVLKGGEENYDASSKPLGGPPSGLDSFASSWTAMSKGLMQSFVLPGQNLEIDQAGNVPMVIPIGAAEQLLGLKKLPATASSTEQLERTKEVRERVADMAFEACYRNESSVALITRAVSAQKEIELNKDKKDYKKPDLQYGLPAEACGTSAVIRDVRTKEQKIQDANQEKFDQQFGSVQPSQTKMKFRVVGLVPNADYSAATSATQIIRSLVTSSLGNGWYTPVELVRQNPTMSYLFFDPALSASAVPTTFYAELSTASQARAFMDKQNCSSEMSYEAYLAGSDPLKECKEAGNLFSLSAYGSNSLGLESTKKTFGKVFTIAGAVVAVIACLIMMGTVGKMIADSRRETAVFRAIGAKKLDIAQVYLLYAVFISVLVAIFAVAVGFLASLWADARWADQVTQQAIIAYNSQDLEKDVRLYNFYLPDMLYLLGIIVGAGLLSAVFPLIRSLRRNPIRDMRDDT